MSPLIPLVCTIAPSMRASVAAAEGGPFTTSGIPLLSKIPILGELFKDTRFQKGESELVILVTPELPGPGNTVSTPVPNVEIHRPDPNIKSGR